MNHGESNIGCFETDYAEDTAWLATLANSRELWVDHVLIEFESSEKADVILKFEISTSPHQVAQPK